MPLPSLSPDLLRTDLPDRDFLERLKEFLAGTHVAVREKQRQCLCGGAEACRMLSDAMDAVLVRSWAGRSVIVMLGLTIMAIGNLLPRTRPNVAVGLRTKLTLANAQMWTQIHRVGGYATVCWGIVIAIAAMTLSGEVLGAAIGSSGIAAVGIVCVSYLKHARA